MGCFARAVSFVRHGDPGAGASGVVVVLWRSGQGGGRRGQRFLAVHVDHAPRLRTDYAVDREPVARLQAAHSGLCFGAELTVGG